MEWHVFLKPDFVLITWQRYHNFLVTIKLHHGKTIIVCFSNHVVVRFEKKNFKFPRKILDFY